MLYQEKSGNPTPFPFLSRPPPPPPKKNPVIFIRMFCMYLHTYTCSFLLLEMKTQVHLKTADSCIGKVIAGQFLCFKYNVYLPWGGVAHRHRICLRNLSSKFRIPPGCKFLGKHSNAVVCN
jgi:hypothetical protein